MSSFEGIESFCPVVAGLGAIPIVDGKLDLTNVPEDKHKEVLKQFYKTCPWAAPESKAPKAQA